MTIVQSKLKKGKLTLGAAGASKLNASCQATNVTISTTYNETGDPIEVLCGDQDTASTTATRSLKVTAIQDFDDADGLMRYLRTHELESVPFTWQASPTSEVASGTVQCRLGDWGGDVGVRLTTELELPITGPIVWAPPPPPPVLTATSAETSPPAGDRRSMTVTYDNSGTGNGVKIKWKASGSFETFTAASGTAVHVYTSTDDGSVVVTVQDVVDASRTKDLAAVTIPYA